MTGTESPNQAKSAETGGSRATPTASSPYLRGLAMLGIITGYIMGPLLLLGGIGWWLSERYDNLLFVFIGLGIALVTTNVLIFKNTKKQLQKLL
jgi:hypothetical protein